MEGKRIAKSENGISGGKAALIALGLTLVLIVGAAAGLGIYANEMYEGIYPGVSMAGISLEGKSYEEAKSALDNTLQKRLSASVVTITARGETLGMYDMSTLGTYAETEEGARNAWAVGHEEGFSGWINNAVTMAKALLGTKTELTPAVSYHEETLNTVIGEMAARFDTEGVDATYELTPEGLFATKEITGRTLDRAGLADAIRTGKTEIDAPWAEAPSNSLDLPTLAAELSAEALPARYDHEQGKVVDGQIGIAMDTEAARYVLDAAAEGERVQLPAEVKYPAMTAAELEAVLFRDLLSTASTKVSGSSARRGNVKLSADFVNGVILNPGEVFDYNQVVGERTTERGFGFAAAYVNGETVDELGGGICQTSSTVYYASLLANLEIVERINHRYISSYIEKGMDATVSWGGPEFRFRNDTAYPIKVDTVYEKNVLTVNIYGTKTDNAYVKMTHKVISTTPYNVVRQETPDLPYGTEQQKQSPYTGYVVETYRNLYDGNGNLISSKFEAKNTYRARDEIILVGTAGKPADAPVTPPADTPVTPPADTPVTPPADNPVTPPTDPELPGGTTDGTGNGGNTEDGSTDEPTLPPENPETPPIINPDNEMPDWLKPQG